MVNHDTLIEEHIAGIPGIYLSRIIYQIAVLLKKLKLLKSVLSSMNDVWYACLGICAPTTTL